MKEIIRYGLILALICMIAGAALAIVYSITKPLIIAQALAEEKKSLRQVMPEADSFDPVKSQDEVIYYKAKDKDAKLIGIAFKAVGKGYSSVIETMVGMNKDTTINAIKVLSQNETPGIGVGITEEPFQKRFSHKSIEELNKVDAITGATISSKAVIDAVKAKSIKIKELVKNE